ncbi:MAG: hypothetical protein P4L51_01325 [Puia sp.]|nr:hypothetical protein [Puia sp.]
MPITTLLGLSATILGILCLLFLLLIRWKNSVLTVRFNEALQAENNGDSERAIQLYQQALQRGHGLAAGNKTLLHTIERRLKTLQTSTEFVRRFSRTEIVG